MSKLVSLKWLAINRKAYNAVLRTHVSLMIWIDKTMGRQSADVQMVDDADQVLQKQLWPKSRILTAASG